MSTIPLHGKSFIASTQTRRRALAELALVYSLILIMLWTPRPWQILLWAIAFLTVSALMCVSFEGIKSLGLCAVNPRESFWPVGVAILLSAAAVALALRLHTLQLPGSPSLFLWHYGGYALWACVQQIVLQCFLLSRLLRLLPNARLAALAAALMFAVAHLPSPLLTAITLILGLAACLLFLRYRTLYPLALAHAILGIAIGITVPAAVDHDMLVGRSYLTYSQNPASVPAWRRTSALPLAQRATLSQP